MLCVICAQSEDTVKRAAQHKKKCYDKNNQLKSTYENRCRDADKAEENNNKLHSNPQTNPKQLTQVYTPTHSHTHTLTYSQTHPHTHSHTRLLVKWRLPESLLTMLTLSIRRACVAWRSHVNSGRERWKYCARYHSTHILTQHTPSHNTHPHTIHTLTQHIPSHIILTYTKKTAL